MSSKTPFTECLGQFRSDCSLTQRSLAQAMQITEGNISKMERAIAPPTIGFINKMFESLNLEKSGHWYEKFVDALIQTRGKVTFEFSKLAPKQIQVLSELNKGAEKLTAEQCASLVGMLRVFNQQNSPKDSEQ